MFFYLQFTSTTVSKSLIINITHKVVAIKLKCAGELLHNVVDTVKPLKENRTALIGVIRLPTAVGEFVSKFQPFFLHKGSKALKRLKFNQKLQLNFISLKIFKSESYTVYFRDSNTTVLLLKYKPEPS